MKKCMQSLQMPHTPWTYKVGKCAALARGEGGGRASWIWLMCITFSLKAIITLHTTADMEFYSCKSLI